MSAARASLIGLVAGLSALVLSAVSCQPAAAPLPSTSATPSGAASPSTSPIPTPSPTPALTVSWPGIPRETGKLPGSPWFVDAQHGFGLGSGCSAPLSNGTYRCTTKIFESFNGGDSWHFSGKTFHTIGRTYREAIQFADPMNGWIFGTNTWVTHNGGKAWARQAVPGFWSGMWIAGGGAWAMIGKCTKCRAHPWVSAVGSDIWSRGSNPPGDNTFDAPLLPVDANTVLQVSRGPKFGFRLFETTDSARTWRAVGSCDGTPGENSASAAVMGPSDLWLMCGQQPSMTDQMNYLYRTWDGGVHWWLIAANTYPNFPGPKLGNMPDQGYLPTLTLARGGALYLTPKKIALIARSDDGGTTWSAQLQDDGGGGYTLEFVSSYAGWASSEFGFYRTIDGGAHWVELVCRQRPCLQKP